MILLPRPLSSAEITDVDSRSLLTLKLFNLEKQRTTNGQHGVQLTVTLEALAVLISTLHIHPDPPQIPPSLSFPLAPS